VTIFFISLPLSDAGRLFSRFSRLLRYLHHCLSTTALAFEDVFRLLLRILFLPPGGTHLYLRPVYSFYDGLPSYFSPQTERSVLLPSTRVPSSLCWYRNLPLSFQADPRLIPDRPPSFFLPSIEELIVFLPLEEHPSSFWKSRCNPPVCEAQVPATRPPLEMRPLLFEPHLCRVRALSSFYSVFGFFFCVLSPPRLLMFPLTDIE